jgi:hypothetical protein
MSEHDAETAECLRALIAAVTGYYAKDPSRASVVLSMLEGGEWYGSIARYKDAYGGGRYFVATKTSRTLLGLVVELTNLWLAQVPKDDPRVFSGLRHLASTLHEKVTEPR